KGALAATRGIALSDDDRLRAWTIERLMCDFGFSIPEMIMRFGSAAKVIVAEAAAMTREPEPLLLREGDRFIVPPARRPLVRVAAARFDRYFATGTARHSAAV